MKKVWKQGVALLLALLLGTPCMAVNSITVDDIYTDTATALLEAIPEPQVASIGGEWGVLGLCRGEAALPEGYLDLYYAAVCDTVQRNQGVLSQVKYAEYSRVVLALGAMGKDPRSVAGYDLLVPLGDFDKTVWQGINGAIWALIALDSRDYAIPVNSEAKTQATRDLYLEEILSKQLSDGGFSLSGSTPADPDVTGMALQALAKYQDRPGVKAAVDKGLACLSELQLADGGFDSYGIENVESTAQVIVALGELGIPLTDGRFVKNGHTLMDNLMSFYLPGKGFRHLSNETGINLMATEQALYALASVKRQAEGKNSLYRMDDVSLSQGGEPQKGEGLPGKHSDVWALPVIAEGKTFPDYDNEGVRALAARGIVNGRENGSFVPGAPMTRAEFSTIAANALGLSHTGENPFADVPEDRWYAPYIKTAYSYELIVGRSAALFAPDEGITRQEAAVLLARAAKLCGIDTALNDDQIRNALAPFPDYRTSAQWAREGLALCYGEGIFDSSNAEIRPEELVTRGEMAQMIYRLLGRANLLTEGTA